MKSVTTSKFRKCLENLPSHIQTKALSAYHLWLENPSHPSLQHKQILSISPIYAVRISLGYRALGILEDDTMVWFWIGSHEDYNSMIKKPLRTTTDNISFPPWRLYVYPLLSSFSQIQLS